MAAAPRFLSARWVWLAMLNYEVPAEALEPFVPAGTEIDTWNGKIMASLVGFLFLDTRLLGLPIPFHRDFEEVNLRFYVRRRDPREGWRRGVVFVKEIVPKPAVAWTARAVYGERYISLPMRHCLKQDAAGNPGLVEYAWRTGVRWNRLRLLAEGAPAVPREGSEEEFIAEHYWGYSQRRGRTVEYQVEHPRWRVWQARDARLKCDVASLYGAAFVEPLAAPPASAFLADGSAVIVRRGRVL